MRLKAVIGASQLQARPTMRPSSQALQAATTYLPLSSYLTAGEGQDRETAGLLSVKTREPGVYVLTGDDPASADLHRAKALGAQLIVDHFP